MRLAVRALRSLRGVLSLALALVAAICIVRGLKHLFFGGAPGARGGFDGVGAALGYFAVGLLVLFGAGEAYPKPVTTVAAPGAGRPDEL